MSPARIGLFATVLCAAVALAAAQKPAAQARVPLVPQFTPGQVLRYEMEFRSAVESRSEGLVEAPQAPSLREIAVSGRLRLEALPPAAEAAAAKTVAVRLRATYEKVAATLRSDSFDPEAGHIEQQYRRLEGASIEFSITLDGAVRDVRGLEEIFAGAQSAAEVKRWLEQLAGSGRGRKSAALGESWNSEEPVPGAPLAGVAWRTASSYLRDEPCPQTSTEETSQAEKCAVLLVRSEMTQRRRTDPTPEEFRKRNLRTSGRLGGSAESLSYISLRTGLLVSSTQSATEDADFTVSTADRSSSIRHRTRLESRSHLQLLPPSQP